MKLENKVAIVTGASNGIGKAIALGFAREGADIAVGYNSSRDKAESVAEQIRAMGRRAITFQMDVASMEDAQRFVDMTMNAFGKVDILVNNAGARLPAAIDECPPELYRRCLPRSKR